MTKVWRTFCSGSDDKGNLMNLHGYAYASTFAEAKELAVKQQLDEQGVVTDSYSISALPTDVALAAVFHNTSPSETAPASKSFVWNEQVHQTSGYTANADGTKLLVWQVVESPGLAKILRKGSLSRSLPVLHWARKIWAELTTL